MKGIIFTWCLGFISLHCLAQAATKQVVDSSVYDKWPSVESPEITSDGRFSLYTILNEPVGGSTIVLKANEGEWEMRFPKVSNAKFTTDSRMAILIDSSSTLCIVKLGEAVVDRIPGVTFFNVPDNGSGEWVVYRGHSGKGISIMNLRTRKKQFFSSVSSFSFNENGNVLVYQTSISDSNSEELRWLDLSKMMEKVVWCGRQINGILIKSSLLVFVATDSTGNYKDIWCYKNGDAKSKLIVNHTAFANWGGFKIDDITSVSTNERYIFFSLIKPGHEKDRKSISIVNLWSYTDTKLQSIQSEEGQPAQYCQLVFNMKDHRISCLAQNNELVLGKSVGEDVCLLEHVSEDADRRESTWNANAAIRYYVKSVDGRTNALVKIPKPTSVNLSPNGKYVIYFDNEVNSYFSYEISSGIYRNITQGINTSWITYYREDWSREPRGLAAWVDGGEMVLIYDRFDIWMVDPNGKKQPVNITKGYGAQHGIIFYVGLSQYGKTGISRKESLIINAVNINTKKNGFYRTALNSNNIPEKLTMGNFIYQLVDNPYVGWAGVYPVKARGKAAYIVARMCATQSLNYFYTTDFVSFNPISCVNPEKAYNWYATELHSWKTDEGNVLQGVLYKPQDFDSTRSYPVIFHYYEKKSFALNEYLVPSFLTNSCNINIPTFVSNGYLVFTPDIDYVIGDPMPGVVSSLTSAARYLEQFSYVNKNKMGIGGCSFGGLETNYLVTHTNIFSAAYSSSGLTDFVSAYGGIISNNVLYSLFEYGGQIRMGKTLWQIPEQYVKNSPIFKADKVETPLLMMHTTNDGICSFSQATEFFTALRRFGKKVWLLEYTTGNHGVHGASAIDFSVRLRQFFDYYLKGFPPPQWMTRNSDQNEGH